MKVDLSNGEHFVALVQQSPFHALTMKLDLSNGEHFGALEPSLAGITSKTLLNSTEIKQRKNNT